MDLNERDTSFEKGQKQLLKLKENFKKIMNNSFLTETKLVTNAGKKILSKLKEEDTEETKKDEVVSDEPTDGDVVPPVDGAVPPVDGDVPPVDGDVPPAPVSVTEPEGGLNSQDQLGTTEFVKQFLKGLPSDLNFETSVDANGIFKAPVNDQHEGQFVVVVYPASKNIHQVADLLEPVVPVTGAVPPVDGAVPPVDGAVPPVDGAVPPVDGAVPPVDGVVPPVEGDEPVDDELKEIVCENERCVDDSCPTHSNPVMEDSCADEEAIREKQRDPMMEGRKNWKNYLKVLNENTKKKVVKEAEATAVDDVSKLERRVKSIEEQLATETDPEEKELLKKDLGTAKMKLSRAKNSDKNIAKGKFGADQE